MVMVMVCDSNGRGHCSSAMTLSVKNGFNSANYSFIKETFPKRDVPGSISHELLPGDASLTPDGSYTSRVYYTS